MVEQALSLLFIILLRKLIVDWCVFVWVVSGLGVWSVCGVEGGVVAGVDVHVVVGVGEGFVEVRSICWFKLLLWLSTRFISWFIVSGESCILCSYVGSM